MAKGQPKKYITRLQMRDRSYGDERRMNFAKEILYKQTEFPKPLGYSDIDSSFTDFVAEIGKEAGDGKVLPVYTLYSNERFTEYSQTWRHTDSDGNLQMDFITISREPNAKAGSNQGNKWNIPGERMYPVATRKVLNDDGTDGYEIFSMKQPYCIDLIYRVSFVSTSYDLVGNFNNHMNRRFKSRQCYIRPNGHFIPMVIEDVTDETQYTIEDRKFFVQSFGIKAMAYIINADDFRVDKKPLVRPVMFEGDVNKRNPKVDLDEYYGDRYEYKSLDLTVLFEPWNDRVRFVMDTDMHVDGIEMDNISDVRVSLNGTPYYIDKGFDISNGDEVRIKAYPVDRSIVSKVIFVGYDPNVKYEPNKLPEKVCDGDRVEDVSESLIVD
ncbi:MAG: hypothetical protein J6Y37_07030 [Paludibacteraceae bacterium]|nr:hypothetical protein [Paludibacteraceae bacterium]